jgi:hypothetical protein
MVDHDREEPQSFAMADLVDPDPAQGVEGIGPGAGVLADPLEDSPDRPPRDPHQLRDRGL